MERIEKYMDSKIFLEDLVSNLMIIKLENHSEREISRSELEEYASKVHVWLTEKGIQSDTTFSEHDIEQFLMEHSQFSLVQDEGMSPAIRLSNEYSTEDLRKIFRPYLSVDMLLGFIQIAKEVLHIS